ncbi:MAG: tetratricopeptide repeat protein [Lutibacter sp.]|uniref:tetratricopeptide repeat protein n=1 Tax=Lutibacter sp. TaxID=1925666 RepID=UPI00385D7B6B
MEEEIIKIFGINTDAVATNRGFYYQYLLVLKKWITNYIDNKNIITSTEVEEDIKEVGDKLIFTQVKCYTSSFSLNSKEVKKSLFNFFILFLKYRNSNEKISFCFSTNSQISVREKLLLKWVDDINLRNDKLLILCIKKVREILNKEIKARKNKLLGKCTEDIYKQKIKDVCSSFIGETKENSIEFFVKNIVWEFSGNSPEKAIDFTTKEIHNLLKHSKFEGKPVSLLFSVLLSEIYRSSQKENSFDRALSNESLINIITQTDNDLLNLIDSKLTKLLRIEIESLKLNIEEIRCTQEIHSTEIDLLKSKIENPKATIPKYLNLIPDFYSQHVFGWDDFLLNAQSILSKKKVLSIYSEGGMGKTSFGKKYLKTFEIYDHIIWLNLENSIQSSLLLDDIMKENLQLDFTKGNDNNQLVFKSIINKLNKIEGENLFIIDIQQSENELLDIESLTLTSNWHKLVLTRSHLKTIPNLKLPLLGFEDAKEIYLSHNNKEKIKNQLFKDLFNTIDYNPLVIELVAKTIQNSFDLTLESFLISLKSQRLDDVDFMIDIDINDTSGPIRIFNYLIERFSLPSLESLENNYLNFLALLPASNIVIEDLILINGLSHYSENKITISNIINSLDKKGLIVVSNDRKRIDIHKITREIIIYTERKQLNSFLGSTLYINWLIRRIEEGYNAPVNSFRYLKYAESILNSIKEQYRSSLYQPLLLLENEFLYAKGFYLGAKSNLTQLISLAKRAENYVSLNKNSLGVIYNNLGLCYAENNESDLAIIYFKKALKSYSKNDKNSLNLIITSLNNLSNIYLMEKDLISVAKNFDKVQKIRKRHSLYNDQQLSIEYKILSKSYAIAGSYKQAINLLKAGIELHKSLDQLNRNDFYLASYHNELSNLFLIEERIEEAVENQEIGIKILENMSLGNNSYLFSMYEISLSLYRYLGLKNKEKQIKEKIELFKAYEPLLKV